MSAQRISYRRYPGTSYMRHSVVVDRVKNRHGRRATNASSNSFPLDRIDLSQIEDVILLTIAGELFDRLTALRIEAQAVRSSSGDRPEVIRAMDSIERESERIARMAEALITATVGRVKAFSF